MTERIVRGNEGILGGVWIVVPLFDEASCVCPADDVDFCR